MVEQAVDHVDRAVDQVHDTVGQPAVLVDQVEDELLGEGHLLGGLEHERVAAGDREGQEPERHHHREVERTDGRADPHRLADGFAVDGRGDVLEHPALHGLRDGAGGLDHLDRAAHLGPGVGKGLTHFAGDRAGQLVLMGLHHLPEPEQPAGPFDGRAPAPRGKRRTGRGHGGVDVGADRQRHPGEHLTRGRIGDIQSIGRDRIDPLAVDVVSEQPGFRVRTGHACALPRGDARIQAVRSRRRHRTLCPK